MLETAKRVAEQIGSATPHSERSRLIRKHIELPPDDPVNSEARTREEGIPVWALVGYVEAVEGDLELVVQDYDIPRDRVKAALLFFFLHMDAISARIQENQVPDSVIVG